MGNTRKSKKAPSAETQATCAVTKLLQANPTSSGMESLSRTDRFFITAMLGNGYPSRVSLSEDTTIGGASLGSIMQLGRGELYDDLKLEDPLETLHLVHLLNLQKIAWDCFDEGPKNRNDLHLRGINLRYALKATDTFIQLYDRLESRWAKQNSIPSCEPVFVSLTPDTVIHGISLEDKPNTLVDGVTLQELMEWCQVGLYLTLKPQNPFESILADLSVRTHRAGMDCFEQADWWRHKPEVREANLKYALKGIESSARLVARLEDYRTKHIERALYNSGGAPSRFNGHTKKQDKVPAHLNGNVRHS
jgi:hypothetical protein